MQSDISAGLAQAASAGFIYKVEVLRDGVVIASDPPVHNLIPTEGLNHILNVTFKEAAQVGDWFIGLFSNNYTPIAADTMAAFPAAAGEATAYTSATRVALTLGTVSAGGVDNIASVAEFTANAEVTIYGGFISSSNVKSGTSGTLISAAKFTSPKTLQAADVLRISAGFALTSA